jgi:cell division protein FtsI (penicillin-binding protein 3)
MEVETGKVLAVANLTYGNGAYHEVLNYAISDLKDPGSTMKLASMMACLEDDYLKLDDSIDTGKGLFRYAGLEIKDSQEEKGGYGKISVLDVFKVSSNVGMVKLVLEHYEKQPERFINRLTRFRLDQPVGIEIPGEPKPILRQPGDGFWWKGSLAQVSYGYEVMLTPLQVLTFYNAVANDGKMVRPRFISGISSNGHIIKEFGTEVIDHSIASSKTIRLARKMLESVVDDGKNARQSAVSSKTARGTAGNIKPKSYTIAGKTGTAQIAFGKEGYGNEGNRSYQASFVGYFPAENPKYSCIVVISSPTTSGYYANVVAGPAFREIADKVYARDFDLDHQHTEETRYAKAPSSVNGFKDEIEYVMEKFDIPVEDDKINSDFILTYNRDSLVEYKNRFIKEGNLVPNVIGMGLKDALYLLENKGLRVESSGKGMVKHQSPVPDTPFKKGQTVKIDLG